jgi:hypothetical protein
MEKRLVGAINKCDGASTSPVESFKGTLEKGRTLIAQSGWLGGQTTYNVVVVDTRQLKECGQVC